MTKRTAAFALLLLVFGFAPCGGLPLIVRADLFSVSVGVGADRNLVPAFDEDAEILDYGVGLRLAHNWGAAVGVVLGERWPGLGWFNTPPPPSIAGPNFRLYLLNLPTNGNPACTRVHFAYFSACPFRDLPTVKGAVGVSWTLVALNPQIEVFWRHVYPYPTYSGFTDPTDHVGLAIRIGLGGWYLF